LPAPVAGDVRQLGTPGGRAPGAELATSGVGTADRQSQDGVRASRRPATRCASLRAVVGGPAVGGRAARTRPAPLSDGRLRTRQRRPQTVSRVRARSHRCRCDPPPDRTHARAARSPQLESSVAWRPCSSLHSAHGCLRNQVEAVALVARQTAQRSVQLVRDQSCRATCAADEQLRSDAAGRDARAAAKRAKRCSRDTAGLESHVNLDHRVGRRVVNAADCVGVRQAPYVAWALEMVDRGCRKPRVAQVSTGSPAVRQACIPPSRLNTLCMPRAAAISAATALR
jgi:hypothetical protein